MKGHGLWMLLGCLLPLFLIFKQFDTADPAIIGVPHVAFADPSAPADAVPRASAEIRAYAYWKA